MNKFNIYGINNLKHILVTISTTNIWKPNELYSLTIFARVTW